MCLFARNLSFVWACAVTYTTRASAPGDLVWARGESDGGKTDPPQNWAGRALTPAGVRIVDRDPTGLCLFVPPLLPQATGVCRHPRWSPDHASTGLGAPSRAPALASSFLARSLPPALSSLLALLGSAI